jgi:hypothetical protein
MESLSARDLLVTEAMRIALLCCALGGLGGCAAYTPGSFASSDRDFSGQRTSAGCLDISIDRRPDAPAGPVLAYHFANRCDRMTVVDLNAVTVVARHLDGSEVKLRPYDPRGEIQPVNLDGRKVGGESLAYWAAGAVAQICVDAATLARHGPPQWLCFASSVETPESQQNPQSPESPQNPETVAGSAQ